MKKKLLKNSILIFTIPFVTILCFSWVWSHSNARMGVLFAGIALELAAITMCKKKMKTIFRPLLHIAENMGIERMATPYEPGKYNTDFIVANIGIYLAALAPICAYTAKLHPKQVVIPVLNFVSYEAANLDLLLLSFALMTAGALSLAIWSKLGQAVAITNELGEKNRYLLRGFAEAVDNDSCYFCYDALSKMD